MTNIINYLNQQDPLLSLTQDCDIICNSCPNKICEKCKHNSKVQKIDNMCFYVSGLKAGDLIKWSVLREKVYELIISTGKLYDICGDCQWSTICKNKSNNL